jgi:hypothetical protein
MLQSAAISSLGVMNADQSRAVKADGIGLYWTSAACRQNAEQSLSHRVQLSATVLPVTVVETLLVLAVTPAAVYGLVTLIALWPKLTRVRYRSGQEWEFAPVFWVANPVGVGTSAPMSDQDLSAGTAQDAKPSTARGGARGNW